MPNSSSPWTRASQALLSMGFSRQEYWSGLPYPPPGALHDLGIKPRPPTLQADSLPSELPGKAFVIVITDQLCSWEEKLYLPHYHLKN